MFVEGQQRQRTRGPATRPDTTVPVLSGRSRPVRVPGPGTESDESCRVGTAPALWVTQHLSMRPISFFQPVPTKIYAYAGGEESASMLPNINRFIESVKEQGFDSSMIQIKLHIDRKGTHTEKRWGEEFPRAMEWLLEN